jgi:hypothetical protein
MLRRQLIAAYAHPELASLECAVLAFAEPVAADIAVAPSAANSLEDLITQIAVDVFAAKNAFLV